MRIKTQFVISMVLFGLTLSVIGASVLSTSRQVARLDEQEELAVQIGRGASELSFLSGDYVMYREAQQRARWEAKWTSVSAQTARLAPLGSDERALVHNLRSDLDRLKAVFTDVVKITDSSPEALAPVLWSRMGVQNEGLSFNALRLAQVLRGRKAEIQRRNGLLIVALLGVFGAFFALNYLIVYRRALLSLGELQAGIELTGRGDLDHSIPVKRDDEIGALSRAFNQMTVDLKRVTASKAELEDEIAEREAAEEALQETVAQMEELTEARAQELAITKQLLEAAEGVARWTDTEELARGLARILLKLTPHQRATIDAWDAGRRDIVVMASEGELPYPTGSRWPIDEVSAAARHAIGEQDEGIWDFDAMSGAERGMAASEYLLKYGLYVPLVQRGEVIGMIVLDDPGERQEFTERELQLVRGIAASAAVAFENARLFDAQRRIADRLQESLLVLPDELPGVEFDHAYHSATEAMRVGGDFYDLFELEHGHVGVVIGDVAGKGLDAAVLTSMVKNTIRAHAHEKGKTPSRILELTNEVIHLGTPPEAFATVFFGILDCRDGRLVYASAGHTTTARISADGVVTRLPATGPLLGAFRDAQFGQAEARLDLDDVLFLYTDGLTEARREGELYGEDRLFEFLASEGRGKGREIVGAVIADVLAFSDDQLRDDLAILSLKRLDPCGGASMQEKMEV